MKVIIIIVVTCVFPFFLYAQDKNQITGCKQSNEIAKKLLAPDNTLYSSINSNYSGDGKYFSWMTEMKTLNIKHATSRISFRITENAVNLKIEAVTLSSHYYYFPQNNEPKDDATKLRRQLLIEKLRSPFFIKAIEFIDTLDIKSGSCGNLYLNLLDDGCLPISNDIPDVTLKCT